MVSLLVRLVGGDAPKGGPAVACAASGVVRASERSLDARPGDWHQDESLFWERAI